MRRLKSDHGAVAMLVAGSLVSLLAFGGLVLDGGNAYSQRRQMQNSADAAALAGANALQNYRQSSSVGSSAIYDAALAAAVDNGADAGSFECELVRLDDDGAEIGTTACPEADGASIPTDTFKVRAKVDSEHDTRFIALVGVDSFTARAGAAASIQKAVLTTGPFMLCGPTATANGSDIPLLVKVAGEWEWNPVALSTKPIYNLWGNEINNDDQAGRCGVHDASFRGLVEAGGNYPVPGWWPADPGNQAGTQPASIVGACTVDFRAIKDIPDGCELALPVCVMGNGETGSNLELYCVKIGRFRTTPTPATTDIEGQFLGGGVAPTGGGGGVPGGVGDVVVIKLIE